MKTTRYSLILTLLAITALLAFAGGETIKYDHGFHAEMVGTSCEDCHAGMETMAAGERIMPGHDECSMCHEVEDDCGYCHVNPDDPMPIPPMDAKFPGFAHDTHGTQSCDVCHGKIETMDDQVVYPATADCRLCHANYDPVPLDHRMGQWTLDHGLEASYANGQCAVCHTQQSCDDCHQGTDVYGSGTSPHDPGWMTMHSMEAGFGGECLVCHESNNYCTTCHQTMLPIPHPFGPEYANNDDGGEHVDEAAAFMTTCLTCHDVQGTDPSCARCHE